MRRPGRGHLRSNGDSSPRGPTRVCTCVRSSNGDHTARRSARPEQPCCPPGPSRVRPPVWSEPGRPPTWMTSRHTGPPASPALLLPCSSSIHPTNSRRVRRQLLQARRRPPTNPAAPRASDTTTSTRNPWRHCEAPAHVRRRHEPQHPRGARGAARQAGRRVPRPGRPDRAVGSPDVRAGVGAGPGGGGAALAAPHRPGLEVARGPGAHRAAVDRRGALGAVGPRGRRAAGRRRRRDVPVPLDARVRAGRPPAVAARPGLGGCERREHGDDAPDR